MVRVEKAGPFFCEVVLWFQTTVKALPTRVYFEGFQGECGALASKIRVNLSSDLPPTVTGDMANGLLVTGHSNGLIVKSNLDSGSKEVLTQCTPSIRSIAISPKGEVAVGTESGLLFTFPLANPAAREILRKEEFTVNSKVWKIAFPLENTILLGSTYGELSVYQRKDGKWNRTPLVGHSDSIFGIGAMHDGSYVASGDYKGNILVWRKSGESFEKVDELKVQGSIEDLSWRRDGSFAAISSNGHVYFLEPDQNPSPKRWQLVLETDTATGFGKCIHLAQDSKFMLGGTDTDLIQVDLDSQHIQQNPARKVRRIFSYKDEVLVLTSSELGVFDRAVVQPPVSLVKYQFAKVSLVGHTGVGKSSLCNLIVKGLSEEVKSTFGRRVWDWRLPAEDGSLERRVMLHDLGGQETVLSTLLPFIADSDVILLFFKQNDASTFKRALLAMEQLKTLTSSRTKMILVETHIDQPIQEVDETLIDELLSEGKVRAWLKVCPPSGEGADKFKEVLTSEISWQNSRVVMRSDYVEGVTSTISDYEDKEAKVASFLDFKKQYETLTSRKVSNDHLKFLLSGFASQGIIEYYPQILDKIIFYDETYNRLKTNVPILVEKKSGIISFSEIQRTFSNHEYLPVIDQIYLNYGIAIKNYDLRIFPSRLRPGPAVTPTSEYRALLTSPFATRELVFSANNEDSGRLIGALSELELHCIDVSQRDGLFAWERNACVYYTIKDSGDAISGRTLNVAFRIGGTKENYCVRLENEFADLIERLFGPALVIEQPEPNKKK